MLLNHRTIRAGVFAACFVGSVGCLSSCVSGKVKDSFDSGADADRIKIKAVIAAHLKDLEPCYLKAIDQYPGASGKIVVRWQVNDQGQPNEIAIKEASSSLKPAEACVVQVIDKLVFPPALAGGELEIIYPFYFSENGRFAP